jgi:phosphoribosylformylglycinamidine (FGAM) synthase-like enzyme
MQFPTAWIYEQFDQRVGLNTIHDASYDVAVLRLPESGRTLGLVLGCRTRLMQENSWIGAMDAILYPYLQLAIKGFQGVGVTDCLNFGNPEKTEVMTDFVSSVEAMVLAAKELNTPIISGNVSFYNETLGQNILPTPATGMVGLQDVDSTRMIPPEDFLRSVNSNTDVSSGDELYLLSLPILHWGVESVQKVKKFARDLRSLAIQPEVLVTQMVSLQGLEASIKNLESAPDLATEVAPELQGKAKTKFKIKIVTPVQKLNANIFYQVLVVIKKGSSTKLLPTLASEDSDFTTELIGTVAEVPYE